MDGDFVVVNRQNSATNGDTVVAGIPGDEATVKTFTQQGDVVTLLPANSMLEPMVFNVAEVAIFGRVVTVMRRL